MDNLRFVITEIPKRRKGAYSASKALYNMYNYDKKSVIISEGIVTEFKDDKKGGIITFSTEVNAESLSNSKLINWFKQKFNTILNRLNKNKKIDKIANKHDLTAWTVGNFLHGRYTANNGEVFDENSLSVEIVGIDFDELIKIAEELCIEFIQESVLVKDYSTNRILLVNAE